METGGLHVEDVLDLAVKMEKSGEDFYSKAAVASKEPMHRSMFLGLSSMENEHSSIFKRLKDRLSVHQGNVINAVSDALLTGFLGSWLNGNVFGTDSHELKKIAESGNVPEILRKAIELEKETIAYYTGLRLYLAGQEAADALDKIIREELRHVTDLGETLKTWN